MNTDTFLLWLAGTLVTCGGGILFMWNSLKDKITENNDKIAENNTALVQRIQRLETVVEMMGEKAARVLHRDDDKFGVDSLLDKFLDRNYELNSMEWTELMQAMERLENDKDQPAGYRLAAAWLNAVCHHKLMLPPTDFRWWKTPQPR